VQAYFCLLLGWSFFEHWVLLHHIFYYFHLTTSLYLGVHFLVVLHFVRALWRDGGGDGGGAMGCIFYEYALLPVAFVSFYVYNFFDRSGVQGAPRDKGFGAG